MKKIKYLGITLSLLMLGSCQQDTIDLVKPEPDTTNVGEDVCPDNATAGTANFSKYIAIGNSLTAGFQAGALFTEGQNNSLGKILATKFSCVGGGTFNQPDINSVNGFNSTYSNVGLNVIMGRLILFDPDGPTGPLSATLAPAGSQGVPAPYNTANYPTDYTGDLTKLNNFGVPGVTLLTALIPQTGGPADPGNPAYNPFYARIASSKGSSTLIGDAAAALANGGTFFSFWLGNNDVLGYAVGGASDPAILTSTSDFEIRFNAALGAILGANADTKGVVGNIPQVSVIPYFTTVPYNPVVLTSQTQVDQLNSGYAAYNGGLDAAFGGSFISADERDARKIQFTLGQNPVIISDESLTDLSGLGLPNYRKATVSDRIVLPASSFIGTLVGNDPSKINGVSVPLADKWVLIPAEQLEISTIVNDYNSIIASAVSSNSSRLALADVSATLTAFVQAKAFIGNGVTITPSFQPPTGAFSEDAVHPNSRGMAFIANIFIDAINAKFSATIPKVNLAKYSGTGLPINP